MTQVRSRTLVWLVASLGLLVAGCGKRDKTAPMAAGSDPQSQAPSENPAAGMSATPAAAPQPGAPPPAGQPPAAVAPPVQPILITESANTTAMLAQLTQALRKYSFEHKRVPKTFAEVASAGYVSPIPQAPPGKKFAVDEKKVEVILVRQ